MKIRDVKEILKADLVCGNDRLDDDVNTAFSADMMSDVLAFVKDQSVLITGLCNPQVIRTAEMMDIGCICFVRGKQPDEAMIELAKERSMVLMTTSMRMFQSCGLLYQSGLGGGDN